MNSLRKLLILAALLMLPVPRRLSIQNGFSTENSERAEKVFEKIGNSAVAPCFRACRKSHGFIFPRSTTVSHCNSCWNIERDPVAYSPRSDDPSRSWQTPGRP